MTKALSHYSPCCENIFSFFSRQAGTLNPFAFTLQMLGLQAQTTTPCFVKASDYSYCSSSDLIFFPSKLLYGFPLLLRLRIIFL
jgi:hypothetical protein